jgi:hypothetical protein
MLGRDAPANLHRWMRTRGAQEMMGPFQLGSLIYPGLSKLVEEGGEMQQVAGKLMANGGEDEHWDGTRLSVRIAEEVADLSAACRAFFQLNGYDGAPWVLRREIDKYNKFIQWHADNLEDRPDDSPLPKPSRFRNMIGFGSSDHYQIYWSWRVYPKAMLYTLFFGVMLGALPGILLFVLTR